MNRSHFLVCSLLLAGLSGCNAFQDTWRINDPEQSRNHIGSSIIHRIGPAVRTEFERLAGTNHIDWPASQKPIETTPAQFKRRLVLDALKQPWEGMANIEKQGRLVAKLAEGGAPNLPAILDVLEAGMDRTSTFKKAPSLPVTNKPEDLVAFMTDTLEQASQQRDSALANVTEADRRLVFAQAAVMAEHFSPQIMPTSQATMARLESDLRFAELLERKIDYGGLIGAAQILARLANAHWLRHLAGAFTKSLPSMQIPTGVTGDIMLVQETSYGLIVIGGPGPNTYDVDKRVALLIDLGGNDRYRGLLAASGDTDHGNAVIIDLNGNDIYEGSPLGLATGRLGVGLLIDYAGDDLYQMQMASGGTGFGGIGILFDAQGNDTYQGNRLTLGAAMGGLGLVFDEAGNDHYSVPGFGIGFGGPLGVGAVIDMSGDDDYQCGGQYPSAYNSHDAPDGKPGDPLFQYDCFGLGTGSGQRIFTKRAERQSKSLAGGLGLLLDIAGQDRYDSANFSQGHGYFFGAGLKLDLQGNDEHNAARYGHGASAHFGVAVFIDDQGDDQYRSTGPYYNGGVAWDNSSSLMIDAGNGRDTYLFDHSTGLGAADYGGWGLFVDEGGADQYRAKDGFGLTSEKGLAAFFDLDGPDTYVLSTDTSDTTDSHRPQNGLSFRHASGGIFVDR